MKRMSLWTWAWIGLLSGLLAVAGGILGLFVGILSTVALFGFDLDDDKSGGLDGIVHWGFGAMGTSVGPIVATILLRRRFRDIEHEGQMNHDFKDIDP